MGRPPEEVQIRQWRQDAEMLARDFQYCCQDSPLDLPELVAFCDSWLAQAQAIEAARAELKNAHDEATHGLTANAEYIDRCVQKARLALDLAPSGEPS